MTDNGPASAARKTRLDAHVVAPSQLRPRIVRRPLSVHAAGIEVKGMRTLRTYLLDPRAIHPGPDTKELVR
jgi:hypothetical protein